MSLSAFEVEKTREIIESYENKEELSETNVIAEINEKITSNKDSIEGVQNTTGILSFTNLAAATAYWTAQDGAGNTPTDGVLIYIEDVKEDYKWLASDAAKAVATGRKFDVIKSEPLDKTDDINSYSGKRIADHVEEKISITRTRVDENFLVPENPFPFYDYVGGISNVTQITSTGLKGIISPTGTGFFTTKLSVVFTKKTGLTNIQGYVGSSKKIEIAASSITLGQEITMYFHGQVSNAIMSQFRLQCDGTVDVEYTTNYIVVVKDEVSEKSEAWMDDFIDKGFGKPNKAISSENADKAKISDFTEKLKLTSEIFPATHIAQYQPKLWELSSGGSVDDTGKVTILANGSNARFKVDSTSNVGEKYIAVALIDNIVKHANVTGFDFWNFNKKIFTADLTNVTNYFHYEIFESGIDRELQIFIKGTDINDSAVVSSGTELLKFDGRFIGLVKWSEKTEAQFKRIKENYLGGLPYFGQVMFAMGNTTDDYVDAQKKDLTDKIAKQKVPNAINYDADVIMLPMYGQSLSVTGGSDDFTDKRNMLAFVGGNNEWASNVDITNSTSVSNFYGTDLVLLSSLTGVNHPPATASAIALMQLLEDENKLDLSSFDFQFITSAAGQTGASITELNKGTTYYDRLLFSIQKGHDLALKSGKTFKLPLFIYVQGEADSQMAQNTYYNHLVQLFADLDTDIKAITGQTNLDFLIYQTSPRNTHINGSSYAQLQLALESNNVYGSMAMYQYKYSDDVHPTDRAVVGHQLGVAAKRIIVDKNPLPVFYPKSHFVQSNGTEHILSVEFDVPVEPMRFDISGDDYHNLNGKQTNFGFQLLNGSSTNIIASEPVIKRGNTLVIKCTENPTNAILKHAIDGKFGGGNLCDSQNIVIKNKSLEYTLDNFAVAFDNYVIN